MCFLNAFKYVEKVRKRVSQFLKRTCGTFFSPLCPKVVRQGDREKERSIVVLPVSESSHDPGRASITISREERPILHHVNARMILITKTQEESVLKRLG